MDIGHFSIFSKRSEFKCKMSFKFIDIVIIYRSPKMEIEYFLDKAMTTCLLNLNAPYRI